MKNLTLLFSLLLTRGLAFPQVMVYEGKEEIPTYKLGNNVSSPIFYIGRGVQGAAGHIYPYPAQTSLSDDLTMVTYDMIYLENEYLKVTIIPAFGGRLFSATDKTNGHELFHRNSVIKPDLIGSLGAWISGGIEWCFPHHHRTSTLMPADFRIMNNEDGSATVWVGETERDLRLRGVIGITLRPGKSYIEVHYRLNNPNDITQNSLFWANVAVTADENFRTFWPPSQEVGVFHSNKSFTHWPISHQVYNGIDYTSGVDLTWWKNHPDPVSFFFWQGKEGFVGGYDYNKEAGTIHVGDVYENKTSKLWQFGPGLKGQNARRKLTDDGKAYVELMTGTFSNNQPGYSWFAPHEVKDAVNFWYPLRDLEVVKNANKNACVTLQMRDEKTVFYGFNTTQQYKEIKATLKYGDQLLEEKTIDIDPAHPFTSTYRSNDELNAYQLFIELTDTDGTQIISYQPYKQKHPELPEEQEKPKSPEQIGSLEDLYLTGRFVEQFSRPGINPDDYYLEALKKSPGDYRVNLALGIRRVKQWRYEEAEEYLQKVAEKLRVKYFQPQEGELFYYMALAQKGLGKMQEAYQSFFQSTWYYEWHSPAYYQLALMESAEGNYQKALEFVKTAHSTNNYDGKINVLYSALLRKTGDDEKALEMMEELLDYDPLNFSAIYEREIASDNPTLIPWQKNMQDIDNNYLEISTNYLNAGMFKEGIDLLSELQNPVNPLVNYYLAWFCARDNQENKAKELITASGSMSFDYCFPYRKESEKVLNYIIQQDPENEKPYYLLGNLLYDRRPNEAIQAWEKAVEVQNDFPMILRNLAFGSFHYKNDIEAAINYLKTAIGEDSTQPLWYSELENYYDLSDRDFRECLAIMEKNLQVVRKDISAPKSLVKLYNLNGDYDKAIDLLETHHFRTWEGGREIYFHYVDAHVLKALLLIDKNKHDEALVFLERAMLYPENLEVGRPLDDERNAMIYYFMGKAYDQLSKKKKAKECFEKSVSAISASGFPDLLYYQSKSYHELKEDQKADDLCKMLLEIGDTLLMNGSEGEGIGVEESESGNKRTISEAYYLKALGNFGLGKEEEAKSMLKKSVQVYKNNLWANLYYNNLN